MNLLLLEKKDFFDDGRVKISGSRFEHLMGVNRVKKEDHLVCGLLDGKMGTGFVTRISDDHLDMDILLDTEPPEPLPLTLVLALPRPKMLKRIIESTTSLGVKTIYLINSWRVEKSFWQSPLLSEGHLKKHMLLGLSQGKDTILPEIHQKRFFTRFVKEELPLIAKDSVGITAHPKTPGLCPSGINKAVTLVIGPEGGFIDIEVETLEEQGFSSYHIGQRILRVETAVTYLISRLYA